MVSIRSASLLHPSVAIRRHQALVEYSANFPRIHLSPLAQYSGAGELFHDTAALNEGILPRKVFYFPNRVQLMAKKHFTKICSDFCFFTNLLEDESRIEPPVGLQVHLATRCARPSGRHKVPLSVFGSGVTGVACRLHENSFLDAHLPGRQRRNHSPTATKRLLRVTAQLIEIRASPVWFVSATFNSTGRSIA